MPKIKQSNHGNHFFHNCWNPDPFHLAKEMRYFAKISRPQYRQKKAPCVFALSRNGLDMLLIKTYRVSTTHCESKQRPSSASTKGLAVKGSWPLGLTGHWEYTYICVISEKCSCPFHFNYKQRNITVTKNKPINP